MTVPVAGIGKTGVVERYGSRDSNPDQNMKQSYHSEAQDEAEETEEAKDTISISSEARKRSSGAWRKSILEHLQFDE